MAIEPKEPNRRLGALRRKLDERRLPPDEKRAARLPDKEEDRQSLVERRIQEAMANGLFDNLPGRGQPLDLSRNPFMEPGQELAFNLLQHNNLAPEWIERDQAIRRQIDQARARLRSAWQFYRAGPAGGEVAWQAALARFTTDLERLNRQIDDFNLVVPVLSCQRFRLKVEDEVRRASAEDV